MSLVPYAFSERIAVLSHSAPDPGALQLAFAPVAGRAYPSIYHDESIYPFANADLEC